MHAKEKRVILFGVDFLGGRWSCFGCWWLFFTYREVFSLVDSAKAFFIDSTARTSSGDKRGIIVRLILLPHRDECP